ncbi:MAG TPA: zf-HC2 domain-containing protein [Terriglobia bacterium]|nr:zf-HC2 domain-containing protein [Terriglobia bacterium]
MNVLNFQSKECERVRRQLDAYLSNELLVETTSDVLKHLESCEACSRELESRVRVREALQTAAAKLLPPEYLGQAIRQRLRRAQPAWFGGFQATSWVAALASLALVVAVGQQWFRFERGKQLVASVLTLGVSDHLHCAIQAHNYPEIANPPDQLRQKLGPEYAALLPVVQGKLPGFQVLEAHICRVPGNPREYVHFIARGRGTILSVILTQRKGQSLPEARFVAAATSGGVELYRARLGAASVAGFETNDYFGFVVSDLGQDEMVRLAAGLAPALRNALGRSSGTERAAARAFLIAFVLAGLGAEHNRPGHYGSARKPQ